MAVLGKGGTGKTTTVGTVGAQLAAHGLSVTLVDLDSTATLTAWLAHRHDGPTVDDVLDDDTPATLAAATVPVRERLELVAGSNGLARLEGTVRAGAVDGLVATLRERADVVLLDLRGGTAARLTYLSARAADAGLVCAQPAPMGTTPLREARRLLTEVGTPLVGVLPSRPARSRVHRQMLEALEAAGFPMWPGVRQDVTAEETVAARALLDDYAPGTRALGDYAEATRRLAAALDLGLNGGTA